MAPRIDADLGDACWQGARWVSGFIEASGARAAQFKTEVAVCHDGTSLYVAFRCTEPNAAKLLIKAGRDPHDDDVWQDDCVELFLSPAGSNSYYQFISNGAGVRGDYRDRKPHWNVDWAAAAKVVDGAWRVEMSIPLKALRIDSPGDGEVWRVNFTRERRCGGPSEDSAWSATFGTFHNTARFGRLVFSDRPPTPPAAPVFSALRVAKPLETGVNLLELRLARAPGRDAKVLVEGEAGGRREEPVEKALDAEDTDAVKIPVFASRPGPFIASVKVFVGGRLVDEKHISGTATRPKNEAREHPRLYCGPHEIELLRRKVKHPLFKAEWEAIMKDAEASLKGPLISDGKPSQVLPWAAGAASRCAFVYRVTGDKRFGDRAREICSAVLASEGWTGEFLGKKSYTTQFHLQTAAICERMAMAYDMLAPDMDETERKRFAETCYERALKVYIRECGEVGNPYLSGHRTMNWLAVLSCGAGVLFIALDGDGVDFSKEIEIARAHILRFVEWYDDDGSAVEHGNYWVYGMGRALRFLKALKENGWPEIMQQRSRKLERTAYPVLYGCIGGKHVANFCDDSYGSFGEARDSALILAAEFEDPRIQWWAEQLSGASELGLIAGDTGLKPEAPADLPTCMVFARTGIGIMRASMTDPDTRYLAIKAGRARGGLFDDPHCQFDLNSVILDAFGESLLADPGYGHDWTSDVSVTDPKHHSNSTPPHNTILVDGRGQEVQWGPLATIQDLSPGEDIDYIVSRVEQGYGPGVKRFDRHAYFIDRRFFVLVDDVELADPGVITWNFHGPKGAELAAKSPASIASGEARLRIIPAGGPRMGCTVRDDHILPRLQWDTSAPVKAARVAWLLLADRAGESPKAPRAELREDSVTIIDGRRKWRLPVVRRRVPHRSSMMLLRDRGD